MVLTQWACSDNVRISFPYSVSLTTDSLQYITHVGSGPDLDGPITTSSIDHTLSAPPDNIDTSSMTSQDEIQPPGSSVPDSDCSVLGSSSESRRGSLGR
jgi:hypothetical protein